MIWLKLAAGVGACVLAALETAEGRTVGTMRPNRLTLILILLGFAYM